MFTVVSIYLTTFKNSMMSGTANPSGAPEFTPVFCGVHVAQSLFFCVVFCSSFVCSFLHFGPCIVCPSI